MTSKEAIKNNGNDYSEFEKRLPEIAEILVNGSLGGLKQGDRLLIRANPGALILADQVGQIGQQQGATVTTGIDNLKVLADELVDIGPMAVDTRSKLEKLAKPIVEEHLSSTHLVTLRRNEDNDELNRVDPKVLSLYWAIRQPPIRAFMDEHPYVITHLPSRREAAIDGVTFEKALNTYTRAALVRPEMIMPGQEMLAHYLRGKKQIDVFAQRTSASSAGWKTHLSFGIDGQNFAPIGIKLNFPGYETAGSPVDGTTEGTVYFPYPVILLSRWLPNLSLTFDKGEVTNFNVDSANVDDRRWVEEVLSLDPGASHLGEIAFGGNPEIDYYSIDRLLGEKLPASFHFALGRAYPNLVGINVDNGVYSQIHEDLTIVMWPKYGGGEVWVDGVLIQRDGKYVGPLDNPIMRKLNPLHY